MQYCHESWMIFIQAILTTTQFVFVSLWRVLPCKEGLKVDGRLKLSISLFSNNLITSVNFKHVGTMLVLYDIEKAWDSGLMIAYLTSQTRLHCPPWAKKRHVVLIQHLESPVDYRKNKNNILEKKCLHITLKYLQWNSESWKNHGLGIYFF